MDHKWKKRALQRESWSEGDLGPDLQPSLLVATALLHCTGWLRKAPGRTLVVARPGPL